MIILDTKRCPIKLVYDRGYELNEDKTIMTRAPEKDFFQILYKSSSLTITTLPSQIIINGDVKELALAVSLFIQGTNKSMNGDMIDEAFAFSKDGSRILGSLSVDNKEKVNEFIDAYNKVYPTVLLLKD